MAVTNWCELSLSTKFKVCSTLSYGGLLYLGVWVTILEIGGNHPWYLSPGDSFVS